MTRASIEKEALNFLETLISIQSPSGFEHEAQLLLAKRVKNHVDEIRCDVMGNLITAFNPEGKPKIMLAGHCDEVGMMVQHISDKGFIYFSTIGSPFIPGLISRSVSIKTAQGSVTGVVSCKRSSSDEKKRFKAQDLWIDIGVSNKEEAEKMVSPGDPITVREGMQRLQNNIIAGRAFDDRIGAFIISEVMRRLSEVKVNAGVYGVNTVQEEVGARGVRPSVYGIEPDIGIAIDVHGATDYPECDKKTGGDVKLGKGPVLLRGANVNPKLGKLLEKTAVDNNIPVQICGYPGPTPTDAREMQVSRSGVASALVKIPVRYMHFPLEAISTDDVGHAVCLLVCLISTLSAENDFLPFSGSQLNAGVKK